MKKLLWGTCFLMASIMTMAQSKTTLLITDSAGSPVPNATVEIQRSGSFSANARGLLVFYSNERAPVPALVTSVGFRPLRTVLSLPDSFITIRLERNDLFLDPVEIRAIRAGGQSPFAKTNLSKGEIEKLNLGQDLPFLLNQTPSVQITSDAGNGVGYTGIRIRGSDASRINVTVNGIPYNDAESQGTFFVDLPDIASSLNSIQIQRGVGTSSNGAGAFGASINLSTNEYNEKAYAEINNSFGSFNTRKHTVKAGTGLIGNHFTVDARLSAVASDGFIDRASSHLKSYFLSGAYISKKSTLRVNIISGHEKTYQAWNGVPESKLFYDQDKLTTHYYNNIGTYYFTPEDSANLFNSNARTFNGFLYENQTDNYQQDHYQAFFNHQFDTNWSFNTAVFLTKGKGYYEEFKKDAKYSSYGLPNFMVGNETVTRTDLVRQLWLDNNFYGGIFSLIRKGAGNQLTIGGGWNQYDGKHYGRIPWAMMGIPKNFQNYYYEATK
ncbi:MAG: TonB-dependent receptor plug domain-containing protein, partial [Gemmatimonadaceae bacterium]|nr:TonB-dependent receptor plug domain-containing protein [Chitinophagaceae bacterium]